MISKDKTYKTKSNQEVRIYAVDGVGDFPVHGARRQGNFWILCAWTSDGYFEYLDPNGFRAESCHDLVESKTHFRQAFFANVYDNGSVPPLFWSREHANAARKTGCIACIQVVFEGIIGQGLKNVV